MSHIQPHKKNSRWDFIRKLFAHDRLRQLTCFPHLLLFVLLWVFCSWVYDDVFYMTEQFSFFSFDPVLMEEITSLTLAPMVRPFPSIGFQVSIIGRYALCSHADCYCLADR